jgi:quercetin dioxygenase-like cupin family protein
MSAFADVGSVPPQRLWAGVIARTVHGERLTFTIVELEPGAVVPEHRHPNEQVGVLLEGQLTFRVGAELRDLGPGGTWRIAGGQSHEVMAGPDGAVVVEAFAPVREDWDWDVFEALPPQPGRWPGGS